ncbi:MAG: queuosine precursor transporter [Pyrinomonadaceae bacterium]
MIEQTSTSKQPRQFKYYDLIMAAFVAVLLCSDLIGPGKVCTIGGFTFGAGVLFFPISYFFGDILTEVYGYARSRRVVWAGFAALAFASLMSTVVVALPPAKNWQNQAAYEIIFGQTPRIAIGSLIAFWAGEFVNSYVLAKLKIKTEGRYLWLRAIGSTAVGEAVDTLIFYPLAFYGVFTNELLMQIMLSNYILKVLWETIATPLTYRVVNFLKRAEQEDYYDRDTNFTPFSLKV